MLKTAKLVIKAYIVAIVLFIKPRLLILSGYILLISLYRMDNFNMGYTSFSMFLNTINCVLQYIIRGLKNGYGFET